MHSVPVLDPAAFSLHRSQRDPSKLIVRPFSAPNLQWLHSSLRIKLRSVPSLQVRCDLAPAHLSNPISIPFSLPTQLPPAAFLMFLSIPSAHTWHALRTCCALSLNPCLSCFLWLAPSLYWDSSSVVTRSECVSMDTPFSHLSSHLFIFFS